MHELFDHTADIGLRARGATREEVFAEAARALFSAIVENLDQVRSPTSITIEVDATDAKADELLVDWLDELLFIHETERLLFCRFDVQFEEDRLTAVAWGEPINADRHRLDMEVKAITYHGLKFERDGDGWLAEVILDL